MSIQTAFAAITSGNSTLNALLAGQLSTDLATTGVRMFPDVLPQFPVFPAARFQVISKTYDYCFGPYAAQVSHTRVQVDGYAETSTGRTTLSSAIRGAFDRYTGSIGGESVQDIRILNEFEMVEMLTATKRVYRILIDFMVDIQE
jgi:hypothetical protein